MNSFISGANFYWGFCSGNASEPPAGKNFGNPSASLHDPKYVTLVTEGPDCFSFITSAGDSSVTRNFHGSSFYNQPVATKSWSGMGVLTKKIKGIQVVLDNMSANWFGFMVNGSSLVRLNFGPNIKTGDPQIMPDFPYPSVSGSSDLKMVHEGSDWIGFGTDSTGNSVYRLLFSNGLQAPPALLNFGNRGQLSGPAGLSLIKENGNWYMFIINETSNSITRLDFGASLINDNPAGTNLGNPGGLLNSGSGITLTSDCYNVDGLAVNHVPTGDQLIQFVFDGGAEGTITPVALGSTGNLNQPFGISSLRRVGDTLFAAVTNSGNSSLSVLYFPVCTASSVPGSTLRNPPPYYYRYPGNYNIIVSYTGTGAGQGSQAGCRPIVVRPVMQVSLGGDKHICDGGSVVLAADSVYTTYLWNTGSIDTSIRVSAAGKYFLDVTNRWGCTASDTVMVSVSQPIEIAKDTIICFGQRYFAGGNWQTKSGLYHDTLQTMGGCDSIINTNLTVKPEVNIYLGRDTILCPGGEILLKATTRYASSYTWQDGSGDSLYNVTQPGIYWVHVVVDNCMAGDTITIANCPGKLWFPNAFTPNNDGLNDLYQPVGISILRFHMVVFDRWGAEVFETSDISQGWNGLSKGEYSPPGTYTYLADYEFIDNPGETQKSSGTFTLVR